MDRGLEHRIRFKWDSSQRPQIKLERKLDVVWRDLPGATRPWSRALSRWIYLVLGAGFGCPGAVLAGDFGVPVTDPLFDWPRGPVAVPDTVVLPLALLVAVPLALVVPPLGPVTLPLPERPLAVLVAEPVPLTLLPRALVAVPPAVAVAPLRVTFPVAVPP
jgi:hypothetical protein